MAGSQKSYDTLTNRFKNGCTLVNGWADYNPGNAKIKKPALAIFITSIEGANALVDSTKVDLGNKQDDRLLKTFRQKDENPGCLELRIKGARNYINGDELSATAVKTLDKLLKKIKPVYPRKDPAAPNPNGKKRRSPSEKSFAAAVGYGRTVITLITGLGAAYNPPDPNLTVANMTILVDAIEQANEDVQLALDEYGKANRARKAFFTNKTDGMRVRTTAIKSYLASFPKLKKSDHYIEFNDALKGL